MKILLVDETRFFESSRNGLKVVGSITDVTLSVLTHANPIDPKKPSAKTKTYEDHARRAVGVEENFLALQRVTCRKSFALPRLGRDHDEQRVSPNFRKCSFPYLTCVNVSIC